MEPNRDAEKKMTRTAVFMIGICGVFIIAFARLNHDWFDLAIGLTFLIQSAILRLRL